jgi:predicted MPP superfamily phosphohydrolase
MTVTTRNILLAAVTTAAGGLLAFVYAYVIEPQRLVVNRSVISINGWAPEFDGLRIVMLGDIHGGSNYVTAERLREIVARVNEIDPDLVVMLGDYVAQVREDSPIHGRGLRMPINEIADNLSGLRARDGVFAVLGNHDGWYNDDEVAAEFSRVGYRVLRHQVAAIERNGKRLRIFGMIDHLKLNKPWAETSADAKRVVDASGEGQLIVLQHSPDLLPVISGDLSISPDLKLMLSAHTHGGQVWLPVLGRAVVPSIYGQKYAYGHVRENSVDLFVTSGIGMSVLPLRFLVPPEIAVLTVRRAPE